MENVMWASTIVQNESWTPSWEKMISAEIPATISGVTSGISISTFAAGLQRVRARTSPIARAVPMIVAQTIVIRAIRIETHSDSRSVSSAKNSSYHCSEKPWNDCSDLTELNENRITTAIGTNRKR